MPPDGYVDAFQALLAAGKGMVFLHHAIAGWPAWEEYAHIIGGRFHYQPATLAGVDYPDSGYRHDVTHTIEVLDPSHPICAGLAPTFTLTDEVYLFPVLEEDVQPLMRSTYDFVDSNFYSADLAIRGSRNDASRLAPSAGQQPGRVDEDGRGITASRTCSSVTARTTYADPNYRRILANAIRWAAELDVAVVAFPERCPNLRLLNLAGAGTRQLGDEVVRPRHLEPGQVLAAVRGRALRAGRRRQQRRRPRQRPPSLPRRSPRWVRR